MTEYDLLMSGNYDEYDRWQGYNEQVFMSVVRFGEGIEPHDVPGCLITYIDDEQASDEWTQDDKDLYIVNRHINLGLPKNFGKSMRAACKALNVQ